MALCRHCGGRHLHKDCPKAPPPGLAGGRPAAKATPMPRPGEASLERRSSTACATSADDVDIAHEIVDRSWRWKTAKDRRA
eukprot:10442250-Heterocapsa_arctica.AAC.1